MPAIPKDDYSKREAGLEEMRGEHKRGRARLFDEALVQAGLAMMAGTSPYAAVNIGQGGIAGLKAYATGRKDMHDLQKDILSAEAKVEDAKNSGSRKNYEIAVANRDALLGLYKTGETIQMHKDVADIGARRYEAGMDKQIRHDQFTGWLAELKNKEAEIKARGLTMTPDEKKAAEREIAMMRQQINRIYPGYLSGSTTTYPGYSPEKVKPQ
jgi:hypothetical protein